MNIAATLGILVTADTKPANAALAATNAQLKETAATSKITASSIGSRLATGAKAGAAGIAVLGAASVKMALDFEESMEKVHNLVGASQKQTDEWGEALLRMAPKVGKAPKELADALYFVSSSGIQANKVLSTTKTAAQASAVGLGETETVANALTSAMNAYTKSGLKAKDATNILIQTVKFGKLEADELAQSIGRVIPVASQLKVPFEDVGAALATMSLQGLDAAEATTALRGIMNSFIKPSAEAKEQLDSIGLSAEDLREKMGTRGGVLEVLRLLKDRFDGDVEAMGKVFPNVRALTGVFNLLGNDTDKVNKIFEETGGKTDDLGKAMDDLRKTPAFQLQQAMAGIQATMIRLGAKILPSVASAFKEFSDIISSRKLTGDEKVTAVIDLIGEKVREALPKIAEIGGKVAAALAKGIFDAFMNTDLLGKLFIGGALIRAIGGPGVLAGAGKLLGRGLATSFGATFAAVAAPLIVGLFARGGILDTIKGEGNQIGEIMGESVAKGFGPSIKDAIEKHALPSLKHLRVAIEVAKADFIRMGEEVPPVVQRMSRQLDQQINHTRGVLNNLRDAIHDLSVTWHQRLGDVQKDSERNMKRIEDSFGTHSRRAKQLLSDNFDASIDAIRNAMEDKGPKATERGLNMIQQILTKQLKLFGIKPEQFFASHVGVTGGHVDTAGGTTGPGHRTGGQRGMIAGVPGVGSGDKVPALLEPGEVVLNREAVKHMGGARAANSINRMIPRFARGGTVPGDTGGLNSPILSLVSRLYSRFGGSVTSGLRAGDSGSLHSTGNAADYVPSNWAGASAAVNQIGAQLLEGIYNPGQHGGTPVSWDTGQHVPSSFWGSEWANHLDHIHLAITGAVGALTAAVQQVHLPRFSDTGFALSGVVAGGLNKASAAIEKMANAKLARMAPTLGAEVSAGGQFDKAELSRLWRSTGRNGDPNLMAAIALAESGGNPSNVNPSSQATGLWQILPSTWSDFGSGPFSNATDPNANAVAAHKILAGQGLGAWEVYSTGAYRNYLRRGGIVAKLQGGGIPGFGGLGSGLEGHGGGGGDGKGLGRSIFGLNLASALDHIGDLKDPKRRDEAVAGVLKAIRTATGSGVDADGSTLAGKVKAMRDRANEAMDFADRSAQLGKEIGGHDQGWWLLQEIDSLFQLRNRIIEAQKIIEKQRKRVLDLIEVADRQFRHARAQAQDVKNKLGKKGHNPKDWKGTSPVTGDIGAWNHQPDKKRRELAAKFLHQGGVLPGDRRFLDDGSLITAKDHPDQFPSAAPWNRRIEALNRIRPALTAQSGSLGSALGTLLSELETVQGFVVGDRGDRKIAHSFADPLDHFGQFGGEILSAQVAFKDLYDQLHAPSETAETTTGPTGIGISELMDFATAVRLGTFGPMLTNIPAFATGGVAPGGLALVGERGPELVNLPPGAVVSPSSSGVPTSLVIDGIYIGGERVADRVELSLEREGEKLVGKYRAGRRR